MALTLVWGQGGLSALSPRLAPILSFYDLLKNGTALPEIEIEGGKSSGSENNKIGAKDKSCQRPRTKFKAMAWKAICEKTFLGLS